ncbi:Eukaryotic translation initiation factor 4A [Spironucleus salmonicida]|uniref:Eukaryotic translation initiation factor 4A n=1 Tax=Spironucleus salmonicida TaxID=348837 RepID=V6LK08_9EUKA|nr:Eukaryotic translation initiation factor 4A [Spironucleus salmonicida]|eukprot:EST44071.1 Eukaryotic translation initiation factor 4A [Spironucleus salmonicida]
MTLNNFEELPYIIAKNTYLYGYQTPSIPQQNTIPVMREKKSVLVQASPGTGKTAAFIIGGYLSININSANLQIIIVSPTRELSNQTYRVAQILTDLKCQQVISQVDLFNFRKSKYQLICTTLDKFNKIFDPKTVKVVIFDEVDQMLTENFDQIQQISQLCKDKQVGLFSATFSVKNLDLINQLFKIDQKIFIQNKLNQKANNNHYYVQVQEDIKNSIVSSVLSSFLFVQAIVFCNTKKAVNIVSTFLQKQKFKSQPLHSSINQEIRTNTVQQFYNGEFRVLVTTDVFGRGMDVRQVTLVVHYDIPQEIESFEHRSGRSGRFGRQGKVVGICQSDEEMSILQDFYSKLSLQHSEI